MKKITAIFLICILLLGLTACRSAEQEAADEFLAEAEKLAQDIVDASKDGDFDEFDDLNKDFAKLARDYEEIYDDLKAKDRDAAQAFKKAYRELEDEIASCKSPEQYAADVFLSSLEKIVDDIVTAYNNKDWKLVAERNEEGEDLIDTYDDILEDLEAVDERAAEKFEEAVEKTIEKLEELDFDYFETMLEAEEFLADLEALIDEYTPAIQAEDEEKLEEFYEELEDMGYDYEDILEDLEDIDPAAAAQFEADIEKLGEKLSEIQ